MKKVTTDFLLTQKEYAEYLECCKELVVFDTEDMGLRIEAPIIGFSFWDFDLNPVWVPTDNLFKEGMRQEELVEVSNEYFPFKRAIGHNIKFDLGVTKYNGIVDIPLECDTSSLVHLFNPDLLKKLEKRVSDDLGYDKPTYEQLIGRKWPKNNAEWHQYVREGIITNENMGDYAGDDAYWTGKLYLHYKPKMQEADWKIMKDIEIPLIYTLRDMHHRGVRIDVPYLKTLDVRLDKAIKQIEENIYEEAGAIFNLKSPKQKAEVIYDKMGLPEQGLTDKGGRSTDKYAMEALANAGYPIGQYMVDYSQRKTLSSNFVKAIPKMVDSDGRIRCSFNIDVARTGRLSSSQPNLQQMPNNKEYPVRKAFLPSVGHHLACADLSQIELRMMAHVSGDKAFHKAFFSGLDIHQTVADALGITRSQAKIVNFAIIYGMGPASLAKSLFISGNEAKQIIAGYRRSYPGYYSWKEKNEHYIIKNKCVHNIFGRVRRLPSAYSPETYWDAFLKGNNTAIQGSAAEMIKIIMNNVHKEFLENKMYRSFLTLTVHDELVVDSHDNEIEQAFNILINKMENSVKLGVPVVADGKIINTWDNMKDDSFKSLLPMIQGGQTGLPIYLLN